MAGDKPRFEQAAGEDMEMRSKKDKFLLLVEAADRILQVHGEDEKAITVEELNEILRLANNFDGKRGVHRMKPNRFVDAYEGKPSLPRLAKWQEGNVIGIRLLASHDDPTGQTIHDIEEWTFELKGT